MTSEMEGWKGGWVEDWANGWVASRVAGMNRSRTGLLGAAVLLVLGAPAREAGAELVQTYTSRSAFLADLTGTQVTFGVESLPTGTNFASGTTFGSITVSNFPAEIPMRVAGSVAQTTADGSNALGMASVDEAFLSGEQCVLAFSSPTLAIGLYAIGSPGDIRAGDFLLSAGSAAVSNSAAPDTVLADGGEAYFLGVIVLAPDAGSAFSSATLTSYDPATNGLFVYTVDDITLSALSQAPGTADLRVFKTGPSEAELGSNMVYSLIIVNSGPSAAWAVEAIDPTPSGLTFVANSGGMTGAFPATISIVPAGHAVVAESTYLVPSGYTGPALLTNMLSVATPTPDPSPGQESASCTTCINPGGDWDKDGLSNADELSYGTDARVADSDGDGLDDGDEVTADTDPASPDSVLSITNIEASAGTLTIGWRGGTWATQYLEYVSDLTSTTEPWRAVFTNVPPTPASFSVSGSAGTNQSGYYRIRVVR
ncbi:MAG: hypothetical protein JXR37_33105 [Kiritimatiellae bacterium]|nr:hypothetical protein [Kiritimatiellia bacterium]